MSSPVYRMIYLGKFADIDTDESSLAAEHAAQIFANKSFGTVTDPLYGRLVDVTMNDKDGDGTVRVNNYRGTQETISYTLPDGTRFAREIDSGFTSANVQISRLRPDGTIEKVTSTIRIIQDTSGNAFMAPPPLTSSTLSEIASTTGAPIVAIKLPSAANFTTGFSSAYAGRYGMAKFVPCFTAGTMIQTVKGERLVEDLQVGNMIWTRDHGHQPLRWIGQRQLTRAELASLPAVTPILIRKGALGAGRPATDLTVSPQHRILIRSGIAQRMFGAAELLVAAKALVGVPGIEVKPDADGITYMHLLFDRHEVLMSNGAETESLYPGPQALIALGSAAEEIFTLFPALRDGVPDDFGARPFATGKKARNLAMRHTANARPLVSAPSMQNAGR